VVVELSEECGELGVDGLGLAVERQVGYRPTMKGDLKAKLSALI